MKQLILYKSDFNSTSMWHHVLEMVGVETHANVAGKVIDRCIETVTIRVQSAKEEI
jgi:CHASE2 domain-containing sensor protein